MFYKPLIFLFLILPVAGSVSLDGRDFAEIGTEIALNLLAGEDSVEKGKDYVLLPTGELYPVTDLQ